jgi:hypothetical protein
LCATHLYRGFPFHLIFLIKNQKCMYKFCERVRTTGRMRADSKESLTFVIWLRTIPERTISHYAIPRSSIGNLSTHRVREKTEAGCSAIAKSAETVNGRAREKRSQRRKRRKRAGGRLTHRRSETRERSQSSRRLNNRLALEWPPVKFSTPRIYPEAIGASPYKDSERGE